MTTLPMKKGDLLPEITATLIGPDGTHLALDGATVKFTLRAPNGTVIINQRTAIVVQANQGRVRYVWQEGDTEVIGTHDAEWTVTYPGGKEITVPNRGYDKIEINARLT